MDRLRRYLGMVNEGDLELGKSTSKLGAEVEEAVVSSGLFTPLRDPVQYMQFFRSKRTGAHFAFERVTEKHINLWVPPTAAVIKAVGDEHIHTDPISRPFPDPTDPNKYGRIASLKSDSVLRNSDLLCVPATSGSQAVRVLSVV